MLRSVQDFLWEGVEVGQLFAGILRDFGKMAEDKTRKFKTLKNCE
jgi:hypothetical protein